LVRRPFLEQIGLLNEAYFLYYEEIDWATRARGKYSLAYAPQSIVYHRESGTLGSRRSTACDYYATRSSMLFTMQYFPVACFGVAVRRLGKSLFRYSKGEKSSARAVFCGLSDSLRGGRRRQWPIQGRT
jgi:GT2 family glycosyltransferase